MVLKNPETDNKWMIADNLCLLLQIKYYVSIEINFPIKAINYIRILRDQTLRRSKTRTSLWLQQD